MNDNNIVSIENAKIRRKIRRLECYIKEYKHIKSIKQSYLNSLQQYTKYYTINIECYKIQEQIKELDTQLFSMEEKMLLLRKELE